jgi:hypothetical protein
MTRLVQRTFAAIGAWWLASFAAFIAVPAVADYLRQRRQATVAGQLRSIPQPPPLEQDDVDAWCEERWAEWEAFVQQEARENGR